MSTTGTKDPHVMRIVSPQDFGDKDIQGLRDLVYKTPSLKRLLSEARNLRDPFHRHCLGLAIPTAIAYDRIMREYGGAPSGVEFRHAEREAWAFVLPDASDVGRWRVQYFDVHGFSSHHSVDTQDQAVLDMVIERYTQACPGELDRLSTNASWQRGMAVAALIQLLGAGQIDHDEFIRRQALLGSAKAA